MEQNVSLKLQQNPHLALEAIQSQKAKLLCKFDEWADQFSKATVRESESARVNGSTQNEPHSAAITTVGN
jgi:hypothetical protein